jgi:hypothetical protein
MLYDSNCNLRKALYSSVTTPLYIITTSSAFNWRLTSDQHMADVRISETGSSRIIHSLVQINNNYRFGLTQLVKKISLSLNVIAGSRKLS